MISGKFGVVKTFLFFKTRQDTYFKMLLQEQQCYHVIQEVENQINNIIGINKEPG